MIRMYLDHVKNMNQKLLDFIEKNNLEENYQNLMNYLNENNIVNNSYDLKLFLHLLAAISENHYRTSNFFSKIEKILNNLKSQIQQYYSNSSIFYIFKTNWKVLLFLFDEKIISLDNIIFKYITNDNYMFPYFLPEIKEYIAQNNIDIKKLFNLLKQEEITKSLPKQYRQKRKIGENDNYMCELIRNDDIDKFISYVKQNRIYVDSKIKKSIYETNSFLIRKEVTLIEYASFFGSIQIFKYLFLNKAEITNLVGVYSMHGNHPEIIEIIKENIKVKQEWLDEAIKCHHNEIVNYLIRDDQFTIKFSNVCEAYNFLLFQKEFINQSNFILFCEYDYISIVEFFITNTNIDVNNPSQDDIGYPPLCIATSHNNNEIVQLLLQCSNIDVNLRYGFDKWCTTLYIAICQENIEIVKILLNCKNIDVNKGKIENIDKIKRNRSLPCIEETPLERAIILQNVEIVELLLENKDIELNKISFQYDKYFIYKDGKTPLHSAINKQNIEIIKLLLNHKDIDVNAKSFYQKNEDDSEIKTTPLYHAIQMENVEIVKLLLESKNIDIKGINNENLNLAIRKGNTNIVDLLLK